GSALRSKMVDAASPIVYGYNDNLAIFASNPPIFNVSNMAGGGGGRGRRGGGNRASATGPGNAHGPAISPSPHPPGPSPNAPRGASRRARRGSLGSDCIDERAAP